MARITRVKAAQRRYATVPVLDENGKPKRVPVISRRTGEQVVTKRGPKWMTVTTQDKTQPLPNLRCDFPGCDITGGEILPGQGYMWIKPKSGPYGGRQRNRHAQHPAWQVWDYSNSLSAQVARIEHDATDAVDGVETEDDVQSLLDDAADQITELAEAKRESAQNIEDGFGHPTSQSEELESQADELEGWAEDVRGTDIPTQDDFGGEADCEDCDGTGQVECVYCGGTGKADETVEADEDTDPDDECSQCGGEGEVTCETCQGSGQVESEDLTDEQLDEWRDAVRDAVSDALGACPV